MNLRDLNDRLLYIDREYVSSLYEAIAGISPETKITRTEGLNAGVRIPIFSAGASSVESKAFSVSTLRMLAELFDELVKLPKFETREHGIGARSMIAWVEGNLSVNSIKVTRRTHSVTLIGKPPRKSPSKEQFVAEEKYFQIKASNTKFALITSIDYFISGLDAFPELLGSVVQQVKMPVNALLRVFSARNSFDEWVATPLVIVERDSWAQPLGPATRRGPNH